MKNIWHRFGWTVFAILGSAIFALGFDLFLIPNEMNTGGVSGLSMVIRKLLGFGSVGLIQIIINVPLFLLGGIKIGRRFFWGSLLGMMSSSAFIDLRYWAICTEGYCVALVQAWCSPAVPLPAVRIFWFDF